ncbi:hypothetical protein, partial [Streptomyces sp. NPDC017958]|uniref:hypothetical protein n=1 Tax=Streptomyces sp. NPDC017958 TaxID=3365021 RepID=UPI003789D594
MPAVVAPWVRTRLRAAPGAALALALLVVVTACLGSRGRRNTTWFQVVSRSRRRSAGVSQPSVL